MTRGVQLQDVFCVHRSDEGDAAALQGATLHVGRGEIVCVLGPSGAGKSTLLRVIAGLQAASAGEVWVLGVDVRHASSATRARLRHLRVGFLGQSSGATLSPDLDLMAAIGLPIALRGGTLRRQRRRASELLEATGLLDAARARPLELSGGERQRAALCVAMAHEPELLLADEPTGELDDVSASTVRRLLAELTRRHGTTTVVVSHDPAVAEVADRALWIRDGRVAADGDALVVGRGGWVRLAPELLGAAGIGDRVQVRSTGDGLLVTAVPGGVRPPRPPQPETPPHDRIHTGPVIELRSVCKAYARRPVLDRLSLVLAPGRMTAVTGRSGSGKSTLLRLLAGLERADSGELLIGAMPTRGDDPERWAERRREQIGYLPQEPAPVAFLSARENVLLALAVRGWLPATAGERCAEVLERVGLGALAGQRVARLSAGEAQRVALARAVACARGVLIVDEPTSRLDEAAAAEVSSMLAELAADEGHTVICATHDEQVIRHADEVVALGELAAVPTP